MPVSDVEEGLSRTSAFLAIFRFPCPLPEVAPTEMMQLAQPAGEALLLISIVMVLPCGRAAVCSVPVSPAVPAMMSLPFTSKLSPLESPTVVVPLLIRSDRNGAALWKGRSLQRTRFSGSACDDEFAVHFQIVTTRIADGSRAALDHKCVGGVGCRDFHGGLNCPRAAARVADFIEGRGSIQSTA